jgi:hypothetical protein
MNLEYRDRGTETMFFDPTKQPRLCGSPGNSFFKIDLERLSRFRKEEIAKRASGNCD